MQKAHDAQYNNYWQNLPSVDTPIIAAQLNRNEQTVDEIDDRVISLDNNKANQSDMNDAVQSITYDSTDGSLTISKFGGTVTTYDTDIDKIPTSYDFIDSPNDAHYKNLAITLADSTNQYADMTSVMTRNDFNTSGTIQYALSTTGQVSFGIVDYSITDTKMQPSYLSDITAQATSASNSANAASGSKVDSEAWAVGTRNGNPVSLGDPTYQNNAKYYAQHGAGTSFSGLADTDFTNLTNGQVPIYNSVTEMWENGDQQSGMLPTFVITSEAGSTVSVLTPSSQTIVPTSVSSTVWTCDVSEYGDFIITASKNGQTATANVNVDAVKIYNVTVTTFTASITVTYPTGATVTCSKEGETTQTASSSPYTFTVHSTGTWTIACAMGGITKTASINITTNGQSETYNFTPVGSTVTPTDDVETLCICGGVWDATIDTIADLLADSSALSTVIASNNAIDYLVRSTTFASAIVADSTAMSYIGLNNYASNTLLADATWCTAICNSTYFESVLNVKVPTMTSNTTPSGECIEKSGYGGTTYMAWRAFDGNISTLWASNSTKVGSGVGYMFTQANKGYCASFAWAGNENYLPTTIQIQGSNTNDENDWDILGEYGNSYYPNTEIKYTLIYSSAGTYKYYRVIMTAGSNVPNFEVAELNFYGREDV